MPRRWIGIAPIFGKYTFTQEPGPDNVLGVLKFNFPNRHAIYMHDTIQPELFSETVRTLSHGCIRVRQPDRLAALLLAEDKGWSPQQVKDLLAKGKNSGVTLSKPVPVHLTYFTAVVDAQGKLQTFADVYGLDKKMAYALFGKSDALVNHAPRANAGQAQRVERPGGFGSTLRPVRQLSLARDHFAGAGAAALSMAARIARASALSDGSRAPITSTRSPGLASCGDAGDEPLPRRRELGARAARADLGHDIGRGEIARGGAAGVEHFEHP